MLSRADSRVPLVTLGLDSRDAYQRSMIEGVIEYARNHGPWEFLVVPMKGDGRRSPQSIWTSGTNGLIAVAVGNFSRETQHLPDLPTVLVLSPKPADRFPVVNDDESATVAMALDHLRDVGLQRFAFLDHFSPPSARRLAFSEAVSKAGLECHAYPPVGFQVPAGHDAQTEHMADCVDRLPKPVGIFCFSVIFAQMLSAACARRRTRVPEQVAILSCGGDDIDCHLATPALSAIEQGGDRIGWEAACLLDRQMRGEPVEQRTIVVPPVGVTRRPSTDLLAVEDKNVAQAMRLIRDQACDGLSVADILKQVPISRRRLEYAFRNAIGRSIHQQIMHERLERAKRFLVRSNMPLADIAARCGYSYPTRLSEIFKRETGLTPSDYRKRHRSALAP